MTSMEVAEKTGLPIGQVKNLLLSYRNRYHASPLVRAGARIELSEKGYSLTTCEADAAAKRPLRGLKVNKAAKPAKGSPKRPSKRNGRLRASPESQRRHPPPLSRRLRSQAILRHPNPPPIPRRTEHRYSLRRIGANTHDRKVNHADHRWRRYSQRQSPVPSTPFDADVRAVFG